MAAHGRLAGDVAIVTGAARNIGRAIAERFLEEGAKVAIADIDEDRAIATATDLDDGTGRAVGIGVDVSDEDEVKSMVQTTEETFGPVTILVNNAAIVDRDGLFEVDVEEFDRVMAVNVRGPFLCTREAAKSMHRADRDGRVVNIASTSAHVARPRGVAYGISKRGVLSFTQSAANALAADDIRVNAVSPTRTGSVLGKSEMPNRPVDSDILRGRFGKPEDQANAVTFLVSEESDFVTGTELIVDGGAMASSYNTDMEQVEEDIDAA